MYKAREEPAHPAINLVPAIDHMLLLHLLPRLRSPLFVDPFGLEPVFLRDSAVGAGAGCDARCVPLELVREGLVVQEDVGVVVAAVEAVCGRRKRSARASPASKVKIGRGEANAPSIALTDVRTSQTSLLRARRTKAAFARVAFVCAAGGGIPRRGQLLQRLRRFLSVEARQYSAS